MQKVISKRNLIFYGLLLILLLSAPLFLSDFRLNLLGKYLTFAIVVLGLDLLWGYTGVLSLGHGVYFGLGAYAMGMYLKLEAAHGGLPDFMQWSGLQKLPSFWQLFQNPISAILLGIFIPALLAALLGFLTFRNRINGVYFTILSQALAVIVVTLFIGKQDLTGGTNGLTGFTTILGHSLVSPKTQTAIYFITVLMLAFSFFICKKLVSGRLGKVLIGIRDGENRLRFMGYDSSIYKTFIYALSAGIAGLAGILFVLQVGIISPAMIGIVPSVEMVLWVALGGRGTLIGPVIGAILVNGAKTGFSESYPDIWTYFLGLLFVVVVVFLPNGIAGLTKSITERWSSRVRAQPSNSSIKKHIS
ncbi:MAG: urea ABC transporter permease subunit UrtC [Bacillota bacterium]|nr:urea ABC transporter permease subunit UrtC [Bacillota bacterium]